MLAGEGLLVGLRMQLDVDLSSIGAAIESINSLFRKMIIEVEIPEDDIDVFYIGQVESLDATELQFRHFDALGRWDPKPWVIQFAEISFVQFDTPYINTFCKYIDDPKPANPL